MWWWYLQAENTLGVGQVRSDRARCVASSHVVNSDVH